jgi:hypothetical protein
MSLAQMISAAYDEVRAKQEAEQAELARLTRAYEALLLEAEALRQAQARLRHDRDALITCVWHLVAVIDEAGLASQPDVERAKALVGGNNVTG